MLEKAVKVKLAVFSMPTQISNKDEDHDALPNWGKQDDEAWTLLEMVVELFKSTIDAIRRLEGQKYVTQSTILMELCLLEMSAKEVQEKCMRTFIFISISNYYYNYYY